MPTRSIRGILAIATLTAGVTWLGASSAAADDCRETRTSMGSPAAALCDELTKVRLSDSTGPLLGSESTHLALGAVRLAEHLGLTGLATSHSAIGLSDLGGVMATSAMPSVLPAAPTVAGVTSQAKLPALPALPVNTRTGRYPSKTAPRSSPGVPLDLTRPVGKTKDRLVRRTLPQGPGPLNETKLPADSLDGVTGLLRSLDLR
ncbi:hypothetical protein [Nonomuraea harbinensis]|uniref:Uncharacterized protein n=1 Tax=Nonomuraea harbinensis TaxID=1286938 RepID=A0ABW1C4X7_9ACTN|nr:hypothetical protein [Nonomuraea harbinensis]